MEKGKVAEKYFKGELSNKEAQNFIDWYFSENGVEELGRDIESYLEDGSLEETYEEWDKEEAWLKIKEDIKKPRLISFDKNHLNLTWKVAAVITIALTSVLLLYQFNSSSRNQILTESTNLGERRTIKLLDGTLVHLNAMSTVSYKKDYATNRFVYLKGEAFFEIAKDSAHPFRVNDGRLTTTALGTTFNVNAYDTNKKVEVTLVTGKVSVEDNRSSNKLLLEPGQTASLNPADILTKSTANPLEIGWRKNILYFNETPFEEVIRRLIRWYGKPIEVKNMKTDLYCSGTFDNESLENVLTILSYSIGFDFEVSGDSVNIKFE